MDAGAGGRGDVGGLEAGKRNQDRALQGGTPREIGRGAAGRTILLRAGRHHQRSDELRFVYAGGGGRERSRFHPDPSLRGESQGRDGEDFRAAGPANRPIARLPDGPSGRGPQEGGNGLRDAGRCLSVLGGGHRLQPFYRAELLGRSADRHRLPGAGRNPAPGRAPAARHRADRVDRRLGDGSGQAQRRRAGTGSRRGHGFQGNHARGNRPLQHAAPGEHDGERRRHGPRQRRGGNLCGPGAPPVSLRPAPRSRSAGRFLRSARCSAGWPLDWGWPWS